MYLSVGLRPGERDDLVFGVLECEGKLQLRARHPDDEVIGSILQAARRCSPLSRVSDFVIGIEIVSRVTSDGGLARDVCLGIECARPSRVRQRVVGPTTGKTQAYRIPLTTQP